MNTGKSFDPAIIVYEFPFMALLSAITNLQQMMSHIEVWWFPMSFGSGFSHSCHLLEQQQPLLCTDVVLMWLWRPRISWVNSVVQGSSKAPRKTWIVNLVTILYSLQKRYIKSYKRSNQITSISKKVELWRTTTSSEFTLLELHKTQRRLDSNLQNDLRQWLWSYVHSMC